MASWAAAELTNGRQTMQLNNTESRNIRSQNLRAWSGSFTGSSEGGVATLRATVLGRTKVRETLDLNRERN
jgi:hypothetical protein